MAAEKMGAKKKLIAYLLATDPELWPSPSKKARKKKSLSQKKIAEIFGVSQSTISKALEKVKYEIAIYGLSEKLEVAQAKIEEKYLLLMDDDD